MSKQTLSISELLQLQSTIRGEVAKAESEVRKGAFVETNGDVETENVTVEELESALAKLETLHHLAILIADTLHAANRNTTFTHETGEGEAVELNLASALDYVKQIRSKASLFQQLGNMRKTSITNSYGSVDRIRTDVKHDIEAFEQKALVLQKEANRLSREIERQSVQTMVEIEGAEAYL